MAAADTPSTEAPAPPEATTGELIERIKAETSPERREEILQKGWDTAVKSLYEEVARSGEHGDYQRLIFESWILDGKDELLDEAATALRDLDGVRGLRPESEWSEEDGDVLWWHPGEAPYVGSPLDLGRAYELSIGDHTFVVNLGGWPGYHKWWTPLTKLSAESLARLDGKGGTT